MTIKELCKACSEYDHNITKMRVLTKGIEGNKKYPHLKWAIDRDTSSLNALNDRQAEIEKQILDNDTIVFNWL